MSRLFLSDFKEYECGKKSALACSESTIRALACYDTKRNGKALLDGPAAEREDPMALPTKPRSLPEVSCITLFFWKNKRINRLTVIHTQYNEINTKSN